MNEQNNPQLTEIADLNATLIKITGISNRTGKPYTLYKLRVNAENYGDVEIMLNTFTDRAGIILSMLDS